MVVTIFLAALIVVCRKMLKGHKCAVEADVSNANPTTYEEVADVIKPESVLFTLEPNGCYSLREDPVYTEIEELFKMKPNGLYGFMQGKVSFMQSTRMNPSLESINSVINVMPPATSELQ